MRVAVLGWMRAAQEPCGVPSGLPIELARLIRSGRAPGAGAPRRGRCAHRSSARCCCPSPARTGVAAWSDAAHRHLGKPYCR